MHGDEQGQEQGQGGDSAGRLIRELRQRLEGLHRAGVRDLPRTSLPLLARANRAARGQVAGNAEPASVAMPQPAARPPAASPPPAGRSAELPDAAPIVKEPARPPAAPPARAAAPPPVPSRPVASLFQEPGFETPPTDPAERPRVLRVLADEVAACRKCAHLAASRTQTVFADGSATARLMFVGEAPGAEEDRTGIPFVGRAGQLLTDMITKGMGLNRQDVYIANILKCRPPENRLPTGEECANCLSYLERQIEIIRPEFLCLLGLVAASNLLATTLSVGRLRGKWHRYHGIPTLVTYHPSYLLRTPSAKKEAWADLQILMNAMGVPIPSRTRGQA